MWLIGHYIQVSRQKQYGWSMPRHRPVGRPPRYAPRELCQRRGLDRDQLQRVRPGQDQRLLRPTTSLSLSRLRSCQDRESTLREQWETLYEEAKALGLDSSQFPPLPELFRQFLDIEPQVWRRGEALREQLREHCVLPGMRVPSEVDIGGVKGAKEAPSDGSEQTFDYDLFIRWLGFQNKDEAMAYFEERRHRRRRDRQLRRLLGLGLMLLAALGHFGVLARAAQRVPGGLVTALALSATLDATLVTTCLMIAMPLLLLLWDLVSAPVARRFDPRRIQAYRATDAVRRLLFMYIFMVWPLLGSAAGIGTACTLVQEPITVTETAIRGVLTETGIFWLALGTIARGVAMLALWQWPDLNQEVRIMASGRENRLVHAFCVWRWLVTASCMWAILLRCSALVRPAAGLMAMQYPSFWGLSFLARYRPLWLSIWLEQGLANITAVAAICVVVAYGCYALYYMNFVVPKTTNLNQLYSEDPSDSLPTDPLSRVLAECSPPGARQRFSPIQAVLLRLGLVDNDRPENLYSLTDEPFFNPSLNKSALCRLASNPIILDDDDELLEALDPMHPGSYLSRLLEIEERAQRQSRGAKDSLFKPRWEWVQVSDEERHALTQRIRGPPPPPEQRPLVELVETDLFEGQSDTENGPGTGWMKRDRAHGTSLYPLPDHDDDDDDDDDQRQRRDIYHA